MRFNITFCSVQNAIWLGLSLRAAVAIWNSFFGPSFGAGPDALGFHQGAVAYAKGLDHFDFYLANVYKYILGIVYFWTTDSLLLGSWLSCVAWLTSAGVLYKIMQMLSMNETQQFKAMLVYALLPSSVLLTSVTLREPYELLALNLAVYAVLKIYLDKSSMHWLLLLAAVSAMGLLHGALLAVGLFVVAMTALLVNFKKTQGVSKVMLIMAAALLVLVVYAGLTLFLSAVFNVETGLGVALQARQESWQQIARAHYSTGITITSDVDLLLYIPVALFHYWFQPLPWHIGAAADAGSMMENILRAGLLWMALLNTRRITKQERTPLLIVLSIFLVTELLWALGTINWGTAARHHLPSFGLLVLAAFAYSGKKYLGAPRPQDRSKCA